MSAQQKMYNFIKRTMVIFAILICVSGATYAQEKADALKLYRTGRSLDSAGRTEEAKTSYMAAVDVCLAELRQNPRNMESYTVYTWSLFRLHRYRETVTVCNEALKIASDVRIIETLGEAYFYLNDYKESLRQMERYIDLAPTGERASVAYFYVGDIWIRPIRCGGIGSGSPANRQAINKARGTHCIGHLIYGKTIKRRRKVSPVYSFKKYTSTDKYTLAAADLPFLLFLQ